MPAEAATPEQAFDDPSHKTRGMDPSPLRRDRMRYILLFAFVSTFRASTNIASSKYTYPYNITLIASLTPVLIAIFDRILLSNHDPYPPLLWPTIMLSSVGGVLIAMAQTFDVGRHDEISPRDNLVGCSLQLLSAVMSAVARILMKQTEHILTPTDIIQTNNVSNCIFPFLYTILHNPTSWIAFRYLVLTPKSLLAWCTMSVGVYSFASTLQVRLVRTLGPGFYSSWVAIRVLGSMLLSSLVLGEGVRSWLEWMGIGVMVVTISIYMIETRKWMQRGNEHQEAVGLAAEGDNEAGEEELVPVPREREHTPLMADANALSSP